MTQLDLITSLKTTQEVADFVSEIDTLMLEKTLDSISVDSAKKIRQVFSENNLDLNDKDAAAGFFETLKGLLKNLKIIKLVLAFAPTQKTIENIYNFAKDTIGIGYILDIEVSQDILGGAIVMFDGKYNDFTLRKGVEEVFANKKGEFFWLSNLSNLSRLGDLIEKPKHE